MSFKINCPIPNANHPFVKLGHGNGGRLTAELIKNIFLPKLTNQELNKLEDAAIITATSSKLAFSTDAYVVKPVFFPGGNIGHLAANGTINDIAVRGATPKFMAASFIMEEGLPLDSLSTIVQSFADACQSCGVEVVTADTKVVNKNACDQIFICTTAIGCFEHDMIFSSTEIQEGDSIIVSGEIGLHGMAVMSARENLELESQIESDTAALLPLIQHIMVNSKEIHCLRDITRGGLATILNELAHSSSLQVEIEESLIPVNKQVRAACELLGLDPLYVACEGRMVVVTSQHDAERVLAAMKNHPLGTESQIIGSFQKGQHSQVVMRSCVGGKRIVDMLSGEQLPRIC